jgi:hypothetical protein
VRSWSPIASRGRDQMIAPSCLPDPMFVGACARWAVCARWAAAEQQLLARQPAAPEQPTRRIRPQSHACDRAGCVATPRRFRAAVAAVGKSSISLRTSRGQTGQ